MNAVMIGVLATVGAVSIAFAMGAGLALIEGHLEQWEKETKRDGE